MTAVLLALLALLASPAVAASPELMATINQLRAEGCGRYRAAQKPLRASRSLDRAARALMAGKSLEEALTAAGYRATESASLEVTGGSEGLAATLAKRGCKELLDPAHREVGIVERAGNAWIILAARFVPPAADQAQSVSREVLALVNEVRSASRRCGRKRFRPAAPLVLSGTLHRAALDHARGMADHSSLSHEGRDGSTPGERATRAGYRWRVVGENIAAGQPTPEQVVAEWVRSPHHCANLMDPEFTEMGVGYSALPQSAAGIYWAQVFAAPRG